MKYYKLTIFLLLIVPYTILASSLKSINVGIYQNKPKIFLTADNKPMGYHIDILEKIAKNENLKLNYIPCKWSTCLKLLQNGQIDIMPDVGYSKKREEKFLFSKETLFSSWSYIYTHKNVDLKSLLDLENKNIAILKNSIQASHIQKKLKEFNVKPKKFIEINNWKEGFVFLEKRKADALLVNRFYELSNKISDEIIRTDIIVLPVMVKYGFSPSNHNLAQKIDKQVKALKLDKNSVYYEAKKRWLTKEEESKIPKWLIVSFIFAISIIIALLFIVILFNNLVKKKTKELLQKEQIILIQSKLASMGEMLEAIAHQWRQPLSIITTSSTGLKIKKEHDLLTDEELKESLDQIENAANHLSNTIDDFRSFYKEDRQIKSFSLSKAVDKSITLVQSKLKNRDIKVIIEFEDIKILGFENEIIQVFMNILTNAIDALEDLTSEQKLLKIYLEKFDKELILCFQDNAGGISEDIIHKVFDHKFTTKQNKDGTGIGLYLSKLIMEKSKGSIEVVNKEFEFEGQKYKGANFKLHFKLDL